MKKFLWTVAAAALVACTGKSGLEKELVGHYEAKPEIEIADSTDIVAQMAASIFSQLEMSMNFQANGTFDITLSMGTESHSYQGDWKVRNDSLFLAAEEKIQALGIVKADNGFKLTSDEMNLILTPKAD